MPARCVIDESSVVATDEVQQVLSLPSLVLCAEILTVRASVEPEFDRSSVASDTPAAMNAVSSGVLIVATITETTAARV
jgi:hypothetical protein